MSTTDWSDVPGRLAALTIHPRAGSVFGAGGHRWRVEPPLTGDELTELESSLGVVLPGEYRDFLRNVSRGGAGPAYGLFLPHRVDGHWQWSGDGAELTDRRTLRQPFPHIEAFNPADGLPDPPEEGDFGSEEEFNDAEDAYWEHHRAVTEAPEHSIGLLYLCHVGCGHQEVLVVSGPARGQMWTDETAADGGYRPLPGPVDFAGWYRTWLDDAEEHCRVQ